MKRLKEFRAKMMEKKKVFTFTLGKGNTRDMFPSMKDLNADLILLGGGNSIKTIEAEYKSTKHNDLIIMTDGVFSMDGDCSPLIEISKLCKTYHALLIVDDAHGIGVLGEDAGD